MQNPSNKPIFDITRFTTTDFPDRLACVVWFSGCNMRCPYCYNPNIVREKGTLCESDLFDFLRLRQGKLDGVVLSGGESTLYPHLQDLCEAIKAMGFEIKLDTNGTKPSVIRTLVENALVDYVALDYKAPQALHKSLTGSSNYDAFYESLTYLIGADVSFEVRTTVHPDLLHVNHINTMIEELHALGYNGTYYLQRYLHVEPTLGNTPSPLNAFALESLTHLIPVRLRNF
ncbi:anaerobic ribonucleoside-triphosphate reductase activating protein [Sulfurospirillum sp. T05]|uniref:Anaerobic ribonucleoside-triphosphate reductase activating protein n=1 Tax=Sulfurospirillum tamanense TaxID=2813362 RepID=A0ABS2WR19_9BACT|nr:anaerobic ribonucleoside-triphosphate reductase activating protein [Sulfurospirillum tamanensis]MBN2964071.1 anaerobic ribonucleoside-triphosphate reductase activating protein [Sulfurospirillum tamanensis]